MHITLVGQPGIEREGLRLLLADENYDVETVCPADAAETLANGAESVLQLILLDRSVEDPAGLCALLLGIAPDASIVVMTDWVDAEQIRALGSMGVAGIIDRRVSYAAAMMQLRLVVLGEKVAPTPYLELSYTHEGAIQAAPREATERLSNREQVVAECLGRGMPNKVIARQLGLSEPTIKVHVKAILRKLNVHNRTEAALRVATTQVAAA